MTFLRRGKAPSSAFSFITDTLNHPPPSSGTWEYSPPGTFIPENAGFPDLGQSYVDPVFGTTITRMTKQAHNLGSYDGGDIYEKQGWWSADGTYFVHTFANSTVQAIRIADQVKFPLTNAGSGPRQDASCHPVNDNEFYYRSGHFMKKQLISTAAISNLNGRDFGVALDTLGGSLDMWDNSGQYMCVNVGTAAAPIVTVYDATNDIVFSGGSTYAFGGGWATISPSGNYIVSVGSTHKYSFAVDKVNHTVSSTPIAFHSIQSGSDHGNLSLASDGNEYFINVNNDSSPALWQRTRIDQASATSTTFFTVPSAFYFGGQPDHFTCVKRGYWKDWVFYSSDQTGLRDPQLSAEITSGSDPWTNWIGMSCEIAMINIFTGEIRRLAHHRARQDTTTWKYNLLPRACAYWGNTDATKQHVMWMSNHGFISSPAGYGELWKLTVPYP